MTDSNTAFAALLALADGEQTAIVGPTGSRWIVRRISDTRLRLFASAGPGGTQMWVEDFSTCWEVHSWVLGGSR